MVRGGKCTLLKLKLNIKVSFFCTNLFIIAVLEKFFIFQENQSSCEATVFFKLIVINSKIVFIAFIELSVPLLDPLQPSGEGVS